MTTNLSIQSFPLCIDPATTVIEAQSRRGAGGDFGDGRGTWSVLHRIPAQAVLQVGGPADACHIFGNHQALAHCDFLVCYDQTGMLTHLIVITGQNGRFHVEKVPAEWRGRAVEKPSARLVFNSPEDRDAFVEGLPQHTLDVLAEPPRLVGVSVQHETNAG